MTSKNLILSSFLLLALSGAISAPAFAIDTPRDPRGTEIAEAVVKWEWASVPGADRYEVTVDGSQVHTTRDAQYYSRNLWPGDHSLRVKAIGSDGSVSAPTATVKISVQAQYNQSSAGRSYIVGQGSTIDVSGGASSQVVNTGTGDSQTPRIPAVRDRQRRCELVLEQCGWCQ